MFAEGKRKMKIKSLAVVGSTRVVSVADQTLVPDSNSKATIIFTQPFADADASQLASIVQSVESSAEKVTGGTLRVLSKTSLKVPLPTYDFESSGYLFNGTETLGAHIVLSIGKKIGELLASQNADTVYARRTIVFLIAKMLKDCEAILLGTTPTVVPDDDIDDLFSKVTVASGAIRRAVGGLGPLDPIGGLYGGASA